MSISLKRHETYIPPTLFASAVHVIGVGGVGSNVVERIARMQVGQGGIFVYDNDVVESHNLPNQAYRLEHLGEEKVTAIVDQAQTWSDNRITLYPKIGLVSEKIPLFGIVFICVDSMSTRLDVMKNSVFRNPEVSLVLDVRMDARAVVILAFDPMIPAHCEYWRETWFRDEMADNLGGCGGHVAIPTVTGLAADLAVQQVINFFRLQKGQSFNNVVHFKVPTMEIKSNVWSKTLLTSPPQTHNPVLE